MSMPIAIKGIREELQCAICHELCTEPKTLPCLHSFCYECLKKWVESKKQLENNSAFLKEFKCPCCQSSSDLSSGPSSLPTNFTINAVIQHVKKLDALGKMMCGECVDDDKEAVSFCKTCQEPLCTFHVEVHRKSRQLVGHEVVALEQFKTQVPEEMRQEQQQQPKTPTGLVCPKHNDNLQWYCVSCTVPICIHCTAKDHRGCSFEFIEDRLVQGEREMIEDNFKPVEEMIPKVKDCHDGLIQCVSKLDASKKSMDEEIIELTKQQECEIRQKSALLLAKVEDKYVLMKKTIDFRLNEVRQLEDYLCSSIRDMKSIVGTATDVNLLKSRKQLMAQSETLQGLLDQADLNLPQENGDMRSNYTLEPVPVVLGHIRERVRCVKHQVTQPIVEQNVEMTVKVTSLSTLEQPLRTGGATCEGFFHHLDQTSTHTVSCSVTDHKDGTYSLACVPSGYGPGKVTIRFPREEVPEACLDVNVVRSYRPLQPRPSAIELHCSPWGVTVLRNNQLAVSTSEKDVKIYDINTQQLISTVRSNFVRPYAMAEDKEGNMWVTDREAHNIQKFRRNGGKWEKVVQIGSKGREEGKFAHPRGIAIHPKSGLVYVSDMRNHRIQVFLDDQRIGESRVMNSFGTHGTENGQLDQPASLAFNKQGQLVVCDDRNSRLQLFTRDGNYVECIGVTQDNTGLLCSPIGVALDSHGRYIVGEFGSHAVSFLDCNGRLLSSIRTAGEPVGEFLRPRGVAVDDSGRIYVADFQNERMVIL